MAPTLYMIEISPSSRAVLMAAKALEIEINKHYIDITTGEHLTPKFLKMNPQHTVPTFVDDDGKVLWDGHAILFYLVNKYGKDDSFYPNDPYTRAVIHQRLHFDTEYLFPPVSKITRDLFNGIQGMDVGLLEKIKTAYEILEKILEGHLWAVGDHFTIADFSLIATTTSMNVVLPIDPKTFPNITAWIKRAETLPYYKENILGLNTCKRVVEKYMK